MRNFTFKIIAILLPFVAILIIEGALRIFGFGNNFDLFVEYPGSKGYLVFNPQASEKYFTDSRFAPQGNTEFFRKKKEPNTFRFFMLGESTTVGFPYFHNASFHRWLQYRLMNEYPDKNFEIINLSLTAVNSYTIKGFAEQLIKYEPDAVLIYAGQNEYYGGMGVASSQTIGSNPALVNFLLQMRQSRVVQLCMNSYSQIIHTIKNTSSEKKMTRMELMVHDQKIPLHSKLYEKGINQFKYNMNAVLQLLSSRNIPVFFSNTVSNLKDLPPFITEGTDENNALSCYRKAQKFLNKGDYKSAKDYFTKAKELDLLRFRAPEELNLIIETLCHQYKHTYMVDAKTEFEKNSPNQLLGKELFTDHVHPNIKGYALLANAFYTKIMDYNILPKNTTPFTEEHLEQTMPVSPLDSIAGEFRIMQLKAHWPFYDSTYINKPIPENTIEEKLAAKLFRNEEDWLTVHNSLYTYYQTQKQLAKAAKIAEGSVLEYSTDPVFYEKAAMICGESGNEQAAAFYFSKSFASGASFDKAHFLFVLYLKQDLPLKAVPYLNYAISHNNSLMNLLALKPLVEQIIQCQEKLKNDEKNTAIMDEIAGLYVKMNNPDGAKKYVKMAVLAGSRTESTLKMKKQLEL